MTIVETKYKCKCEVTIGQVRTVIVLCPKHLTEANERRINGENFILLENKDIEGRWT
jgi:hypothetical protein